MTHTRAQRGPFSVRLVVKKYPYRGQQSFVNNQKHVSGKERKLERDLAEVLCTYDDRNHPKGETLSMESRVFRVKIVTAFLKGGVAINKINCFQSILQESSYRLTSGSHVSEP